MGGDAIWAALTEHLGVGHDETTDDGKVTLEHVECNAACDYAPVVMVNWEFFDNQTPQSAPSSWSTSCAPARRSAPTRGPTRLHLKEAARVLAGFADGSADEGRAGRASRARRPGAGARAAAGRRRRAAPAGSLDGQRRGASA